MEITLEHIDEFIDTFDQASSDAAFLRSQVADLSDEVDAIKMDAEEYANENSATSTGRPAVKKHYLSKHERYNTAVTELKRARNDLTMAEAVVESCRMRTWSRIAMLQFRSMKTSEEHTHISEETTL